MSVNSEKQEVPSLGRQFLLCCALGQVPSMSPVSLSGTGQEAEGQILLEGQVQAQSCWSSQEAE